MVDNAEPQALDDLIASDPAFDVESLYPAMLSLGVIDGSTYSILLGTSTPVLYYNEQAFVAAGLDPESPPRMWDEVTEAATVLKQAGCDGVAVELREHAPTIRIKLPLPSGRAESSAHPPAESRVSRHEWSWPRGQD